MLRSLVGSEMCIRDSHCRALPGGPARSTNTSTAFFLHMPVPPIQYFLIVEGLEFWSYPSICLLYTSDAADDLLCVDLGGRRIIKKKKKNNT